MTIIVSLLGVGKGWLYTLLKKLLGEERVLVTETPEKDIYGDFNGLMATAYLVILNEVEPKNTRGALGRINALVTDDTFNLVKKGKDSVTLKSFHKVLAGSNFTDAFSTTKDNRRYNIMKASDDKVNDADWFDKIHKLLDSRDFQKTIWAFLQKREPPHQFTRDNIIENDILEIAKEKGQDAIECWLVDGDIPCDEWVSADVIWKNLFKYLKRNNFKSFLEYTTKQKLGINLKSKQLMDKRFKKMWDKKHTNQGEYYKFDKKEILTLNHECLIDASTLGIASTEEGNYESE